MYRHSKNIASALIGLAGVCLLPGVALSTLDAPGATKEDVILGRPISISIQDASVIKAVDLLSSRGGVAISLIVTDAAEGRKVNLAPGNLGKVLDDLVAQVPVYRYVVLKGRVVLYPRDSSFEAELPDPEIREVKRIEAAAQYVDWLSRVVPSLGTILPPPMKGNTEAHIYAEPVSIIGRGRILDHLVQLLGDDSGAFFSIVPAPSGSKILVLGEIPESS